MALCGHKGDSKLTNEKCCAYIDPKCCRATRLASHIRYVILDEKITLQARSWIWNRECRRDRMNAVKKVADFRVQVFVQRKQGQKADRHPDGEEGLGNYRVTWKGGLAG